jgi:hypothetical protein
MAGLFVEMRGGTRGGQDQFKWDDVKLDKHRENYLGHSVLVWVLSAHVYYILSILGNQCSSM